VIETASDDWGRSEYDERMECAACDKKFVYAQVRGRDDRPHHWIDRVAWEHRQAQALDQQRRDEASTANARERFGPMLIARVADVRSRRALWDFFRQARLTSRSYALSSFSAFNRSVREKGRDQVIRELIDHTNAEVVSRLTAEC
jgi:hypothetical protein